MTETIDQPTTYPSHQEEGLMINEDDENKLEDPILESEQEIHIDMSGNNDQTKPYNGPTKIQFLKTTIKQQYDTPKYQYLQLVLC